VMFVDSLHQGIEVNPIHDNVRDGYAFLRWKGAPRPVASKAFADDTWVGSGTFEGLERIHEWVQAWCDWHHLILHAQKTRFLALEWKSNPEGGRGTYARQTPVVPDKLFITIGDEKIPPTPLHKAVKYMGVHIQMDLDWSEQCKMVTKQLWAHRNAVTRHR